MLHLSLYIFCMYKNNINKSIIHFGIPLLIIINVLLICTENINIIATEYCLIFILYLYIAIKESKKIQALVVSTLFVFAVSSNYLFNYMATNQYNQIEKIRSEIKVDIINSFKNTVNNLQKKEIAEIAKKYKSTLVNNELIKSYTYKRIAIMGNLFWFILIGLILFKHKNILFK